MSRKLNYAELWQKGGNVAAQESIIAGLHRMIAQKDANLQQLNAQITENLQIMEQMEKQFIAQQNQIKQLQTQGGANFSGNQATGMASSDDKGTITRLNQKIAELENKLYIFSNLPDRITDLEGKLEKQVKVIDQFEDRELKYKEQIRKLYAESGSQQLIQDLEDKNRKQDLLIEKLQKELEKSQGNFGRGSSDGDTNQIRQQLAQVQAEKSQFMTQLEQTQKMHQETEAKLKNAFATIESLRSNSSTPISGASGPDAGKMQELQRRLSIMEGDIQAKDAALSRLKMQLEQAMRHNPTPSPVTAGSTDSQGLQRENSELKGMVEKLKGDLRKEQMKIEELVEKVQAPTDGVNIKEIQSENQSLNSKIQQLTKDLDEKNKMMKSSPSELVEELNLKLNKLKMENNKLQEENASLKSGSSSPTPIPAKPGTISSFKPSAPVIRSIDSGMGKEKETQMNQEIAQLKKQVAEKDAQLIQTTKDLTETQTQIAEMKAAGPQDANNANMMNLLNDLQSKIKKLKEQLRQKEEEIAGLKGGK